MKYLFTERSRSARIGRIPAVILVACFVAMTGCFDSTGPKTFCCIEKPAPTVAGLAVLSAELHTATDGFAQGERSKAVRKQMVSAIKALGDEFLAGRVVESRAAIACIRSLLASLDEVSAIELAPVGLAVDYVERRMNAIILI